MKTPLLYLDHIVESIARFRNMAVHHYLDIDLGVIWTIVEQDLEPLRIVAEQMMRDLEGDH